jgi:heptosyltransferase-2
MLIGINPYAGGRWKSKELPEPELTELVRRILDAATPIASIRILLLGAGRDYERNKEVEKRFCDERLCAINTDESVLHLAGAIGALELLITSDSLALHLGIAQRVPCSAFFAPTSGAEIDSFGLVAKVLSTSADYCCYRSHADNSSVTATRILSAASGLRSCVESDELNRLLAAWS